MRFLIRLGMIAVTTILWGIGSSCPAQEIPSGSYLETCRNIQVQGSVLYAYCRDTDNRWRAAELYDYRDCARDITNVDGALRCERGASYSRPYGSYVETCRDIQWRGNKLRAKCQTTGGNWVRTSLDHVDRCVSQIVNDDGHLECTTEGSVPRASYVETCRQIYLRGDTLRAVCQNTDGRWVWTSLDGWDDCRGGIVNVDGQLRCLRDRNDDRDRYRDRDGDRLPRGSYGQTCRNITMRGGTLRAECETSERRWIWTELYDADRCRGDIENIDGQLRCPR
jgi:hypothetical protein